MSYILIVIFKFLNESLNTGTRFLSAHNIGTEDVLKLKYAPALPEPESKTEGTEEEWVATLTAARGVEGDKSSLVSGNYAGSLTCYSLSPNGELLRIGEIKGAHKGAVKSVAQTLDDKHYVSSCGKDGKVKLWKLDTTGSFKLVADCLGHADSAEATSLADLSSHVLVASTGWDKSVCCWRVPAQEDSQDIADTKAKKRRKQSGVDTQVVVNEPYLRFEEHTDKVSCLAWGDRRNPVVLFSGSWDHSIRSWDLSRECGVLTFNGSKVVTSIASNPSAQMLATGHADHVIRLWDTRASGESVVKLTLRSHEKFVSAVDWSQRNPNLLVSSSHDRMLKIWDIRSTIPLHTIEAHDDKVLCVAWNHDCTQMISGGADSKLKVNALKQR